MPAFDGIQFRLHNGLDQLRIGTVYHEHDPFFQKRIIDIRRSLFQCQQTFLSCGICQPDDRLYRLHLIDLGGFKDQRDTLYAGHELWHQVRSHHTHKRTTEGNDRRRCIQEVDDRGKVDVFTVKYDTEDHQ